MAGSASKLKPEGHNRNLAPPLQELHNSPPVQTKLEIGKPGDKYEQEADQMADQVMMAPYDRSKMAMMTPNPDNPTLRMMPMPRKNIIMMAGNPDNPTIRLKAQVQRNEMNGCEDEEMIQAEMHEEDEKVQTKPAIQKAENNTTHASPELTASISSTKGQGQSLTKSAKQEMGSKMGADFSNVSIHTDGNAVQMNQNLGAKAFTHGNDIYFNKGNYNPDSSSGKHLLAHELTHTVQQGSSAQKIQKQDNPVEEAQKIYDKYTGWVTDEKGMATELATLVGQKPEVILRVIYKLDGNDKAQVSLYLFENLSDDKLTQMNSQLARYLYNIILFDHISELTSDEQDRAFKQGERIMEAYKKATENVKEESKGKGEDKSDVAKVKSLAIADFEEGIEEYKETNIAGGWSTLKRKMAQRDKQLEGAKIYVGQLSQPQKKAYENLKERWPSLRSYLNGTTPFDPAEESIASKTVIDNTIKADQDDMAILKPKKNFGMTIAVIKEMHTALNKFLGRKGELSKRETTLADEKIEFHRFDTLFEHTDVIKLINAIPHIKVTASDIKAITAQETGDFTNITVAGIKDKKSKGIISKEPNPSVFKGLGQHDTGSRDEGIAWAKKKGVTITHSTKDDARSDPQRAILLTAAYLGRVTEELLYPGLPEIKPTGIELKKMILAGYNGGPANVKRAAKAFVGSVKKKYTWNNIKNHENISGQMRIYVSEISQRLP